jgi:SAM-dependent methyltransferase
VDVKEQQKKHWNTVAGGWGTWLDWTSRNFQPIAAWLGNAAHWQPGARVLDVACGSGFPALAAAAAVRPGGTVVATDISPEMLAVAASRARRDALDNIEFVEMDAEQLTFGDGEFDAVMNVYGLMFSPDPSRAIAEARRILRAGGHFSAVTWDEPSRSPFFSVIIAVAVPFLSIQPPVAGAPGPWRLSSATELEALLREAGFSDARVDRVPMTVELASADEYLQVFSDVAWGPRVAAPSDSDFARLREAVTEAVQPHIVGGRVRLVASSLCAAGTRTP